MSVTYFVALPFVDSEEGPVPGEAMECPNESNRMGAPVGSPRHLRRR